MKKTWRNFMSGFTYDQYKDLIAERNYKQDVDQYYDTLVEVRNDIQKSNTNKDFLYAKVNPYAPGVGQKRIDNKRTLASYTPQELLNLDAQQTNNRLNDLNEEVKAY